MTTPASQAPLHPHGPPPRNPASAGRVLYDGDCAFCRRWVMRFAPWLRRQGFTLETLQAAGLPLDELRCELADGRSFGGADALLECLRRTGWGRPLAWLGSLPGIHPLLQGVYRRIAARRHCLTGRGSPRPPQQPGL